MHTSGHSVGLTVTEYPNITGDAEEIAQPGMVFALENGVYPFDETVGASSIEISFRMEDEAVVTESGSDGCQDREKHYIHWMILIKK